jgi:hypothetical protein
MLGMGLTMGHTNGMFNDITILIFHFILYEVFLIVLKEKIEYFKSDCEYPIRSLTTAFYFIFLFAI